MEDGRTRLRGMLGALARGLQGRLHRRIRLGVDAVVGVERPLDRASLDDLNRTIFRATQLTAGVEVQLDAISALVAPPTGPFHPEMTMAAVLRRHPHATAVLAAVGLPGCGGCAVRHDETLGEAIDAYGFDGAALLRDLNALLADAPGAAPTRAGVR